MRKRLTCLLFLSLVATVLSHNLNAQQSSVVAAQLGSAWMESSDVIRSIEAEDAVIAKVLNGIKKHLAKYPLTHSAVIYSQVRTEFGDAHAQYARDDELLTITEPLEGGKYVYKELRFIEGGNWEINLPDEGNRKISGSFTAMK